MSAPIDSGVFRISASAGSGKTYNLTRLFVDKALRFPTAYQGIVAITFTNKAANELKERIVSRLKELSDPTRKDKTEDLFGFPDRHTLALKASQVLGLVLHNFDNLNVTTIDSFFQSIFSQLAYEAGLPQGLTTEVDLTLIKQEVLKEGLTNMPDETKRILVGNLIDHLKATGKDWRPQGYISKGLLNTLFDDKVIDFQSTHGPEMLGDSTIRNARSVLQKYCLNFENQFQTAASQIIGFCKRNRLSPEELDPKADVYFIKEITKIQNVARGILVPEGRIVKHGEGKFHRPPKSRKLTGPELEESAPLLQAYWEVLNQKNLANYSLAKKLEEHLSSTRLLMYFREVLKQQNDRASRFVLAEIKFLLRKMIGDSDVPYLFERLGNVMHTLLIDEFQDTDQVQWKVLEPLAKAIVDNGGLVAVVGDVKQSIYGWRGADSSLFKEGIDKSMQPIQVQNRYLDTNYRSEARIVAFNNWLFTQFAESLIPNQLAAGNVLSDAGWHKRVLTNYEDVSQKSKDEALAREGGFVEVRARKKAKATGNETDQEDEEINPEGKDTWLIEEIKSLQDNGFKASDLAILVRKNKEIEPILQALDRSEKEGASGYNFSFSTASIEKAGEKAIFQFLILTLKFSYLNTPDSFHFTLMESLATTLGLDPRFQSQSFGSEPAWRSEWVEWNGPAPVDFETDFKRQILFFGLDKILSIQNDLQEFSNLLIRYVQREAMKYPDFFLWWEEKVSQLELPGSQFQDGIRVMTIHKAKGLDFGVVILPVVSNSHSDNLHKGDFWAYANHEPWNAHPLLKAQASPSHLESDLADVYQEDVYKRALENLNNLYVACTRPVHGLIIDITSDSMLEPDPKHKKEARLAFQLAMSIKEANQKNQLPFTGYTLDEPENGDVIFRFTWGKRQKGFQKDETDTSDVFRQKANYIKEGQTPWVSKPFTNEATQVGILVHAVLEKTSSPDQWPGILKKESFLRKMKAEVEMKAAEQLEQLFLKEEMRNWFSDKYRFYPEQEMISPEGDVLRVDRMLVKNDEWVVLDYKTGDENPTHKQQMSGYLKTLGMATGKIPKGYLIYSDQNRIVEVL